MSSMRLAIPNIPGPRHCNSAICTLSWVYPCWRGKTVLGVIALIRRTVRPFTEKQIELVTTFADQAVIAIENARLFEEVQARTSDLARCGRRIASPGRSQPVGQLDPRS